MLKENKIREANLNQSETVQPVITAGHSQERSFIGYSKAERGYEFHSENLRYYPYRHPVPAEEWITDSPGAKTSEYRLMFPIHLRTTHYVRNYQMRPVAIPFIDRKGMKREYRPLMLVNYRKDIYVPNGERNLLADIWSDEDIRANADWFIPAWRAAHRFAGYKRLNFRVFRGSFFLSDYFANCRFIDERPRDLPNEEHWLYIRGFIKNECSRTFEQLVDGALKEGFELEEFSHSIWVLLRDGYIQTDWYKLFGNRTLFRAP